MADILARLPGLEIGRSGGIGGTTSVFLRGGNTQHTAVYLDGVRLDTQSGAGGVVWESIRMAQIDRIEVASAGAVYGSDAINGVVQLFTDRGEARRHLMWVWAWQPWFMQGRGGCQWCRRQRWGV